MRIVVMLVVLLVGCVDSGVSEPDAGFVDVDGPRDAPIGFVCEAFGEECVSAPYPSNTTCHEGKGWCIDDVCRPQCSSTTMICDTLELAYSPAGAGYCAPKDEKSPK
jgi:hypothetical protein